MQKLKIALVVQRYGLEVNGGAELECRLYAERLIPFYDVTVLTTCAIDYVTWKNEYSAGTEIINGVRVIRFPTDRERNQQSFGKIHEKVMANMGNREEEIEWMEEQGPVSPGLIEYIKNSRDEYASFVFMTYLYYLTFHGLPFVAGKSVLIPTAHDEPPIYLSIFKNVFTMPKAIFYNTPSEKVFVHKLFSNQNIPSEVGGAGVDLPELMDSGDFCARYGIRNPYMVYVGRIDESKGCRELFDYLDYYNAKRKEKGQTPLTLVLVGKEILEVPKRDDIISLGFVSENDKYAAILESEFLVLPSRFESLSIVVLEAFRLKKAVLVNGHCEVLKDHCKISNGGFYYLSKEEFALYVDYLLLHPDVRRQMGRNGRMYQKQYYSWDSIITKLCELINFAAK